MNCLWLPMLSRCRCGWRRNGEWYWTYSRSNPKPPVFKPAGSIEEHLGRPLTRTELLTTPLHPDGRPFWDI